MRGKIKTIVLVIMLFLLIALSAVVVSMVAVNENKPPIASASASVTSGKVPLKVSFKGSGLDSDGTVSSYIWDFGDGGTSKLQNPTHTYQKSGDYIVSLVVTDNDGSIGQKEITINVRENIPPVAHASASKTSGEEPLSVTFSGEGTDSDGTIASYRWDFGNKQTSNEQNPTYVYHSTGTYTAKLTVTDDNGATATDEVQIEVDQSSDWAKWYWYYYYPYYNPNNPWGPYNPYMPPPWSPDNPYFWLRPLRATLITLSQN
jgi:PKD repeat protein